MSADYYGLIVLWGRVIVVVADAWAAEICGFCVGVAD